uniref:Predicted protein n=1 Tax=Hordeum vulgare subsp. vulgare TaxID=112509 RepID=F2E1A3_HORVV|nr:predicted protein [Hordeum vulgare subsp. vulgare]
MKSGLFTASGSCQTLLENMNVYFRVMCEYDTITVGNNSVSKSAVSIVVAAFDAAIIVIFIIMISTLKYAQKNAINSVQQKAYSASSYTIELKNLPQDLPAEELSAKLWSFLDGKLGEKSIEAGNRVVDIQIVLPNKLIEYSKDVGTLIHTKNTLIREFIQNYLPDYAKTEINLNELQKLIQTMIQQNHPQVKEAEKLFRKIKTLSIKKIKLLSEIQKLKTTKNVRIVSAFVTFSSIPARNKILDAFISTPFERFIRAICGGGNVQDKVFEGKVLRAKSAADPGSILWENIGESKTNVYGRRAFSLALTVILWGTTAILLIVSTYYKNEFKKNFPTVDCGDYGDVTIDEAAKDYALGQYQVGKLECYCSDDLVGRLYDIFPNNQTLCVTWFNNKLIETSVTFAIVFIVLVINYGVQFVFQALSKFEKHSTLNNQLATRVIKTFAAQFLNTGLLLLLINAKLDGFSLWQGQFRDLSPLWYVNVGSTLLSTMFINVFTVPTVKITAVIFNRIARCYDRGCKADPKMTKKKTQAKYENLYSGPEFIVDFRYSQILTLTFVCFFYSGSMPLLYFTSLLQLVITYFFDKVVLLRVSKLPKNYDESLEFVVRPTLYVILLLHLIMAIFGFGNTQIFQGTSNTFTSYTDSISNTISDNSANVVTRFFKRTVLTQNIVLLVLLIIIIAGFLVKGVLVGFLKRTIFAFFSNDEEKTNKKGAKIVPGALTDYTFFHVIKTEDLATLIRLTKVTIKSTQNQDLIKHLNSKLALLKQEYQMKQKSDPHPVNFIGFHSYDVRVQASYSDQFAIAEMIDDETLD